MLTSLLMLSAFSVGQTKVKLADKPLELQSNAQIRQAVFHPDGKRVYFLTTAGVEAHDVTTGQRLFVVPENGSIVVSPDGKRLALVQTLIGMITVTGNVVVLDADTGKEQHKRGGTLAAFSPDGRWLVTQGSHSFGGGKRPPPEVRITELTSGKTHLAQLKRDMGSLPIGRRQREFPFRFTRDGKTLVSGWRKETGQWQSLAACGLTSGMELEKMPDDDQLERVHDPQASLDGKRFVSNWQVFDENGKPVAKLEIPKSLDRESQGWRAEFQITSDGKHVFGVSHSRWRSPVEDDKGARIARKSHLQVWDAATGKWVETVFTVEDIVTLPKLTAKKLGGFYRQDPLIVVNRQATLAISYNARGAVTVWDLATRKPLRKLRDTGHSSRPQILAFNADGSQLASASSDGEVVLWDTKSGQPLRAMERAVALGDLHFRPKSQELVGVGHDTIYVWNADTGKLLRTFERKGNAFHFAFHPAGKVIAVADHWHDDVRFVDVDTGKTWRLLPAGRGTAVAFHPGGKWLLTLSSDGPLRSWDFESGKPHAQWNEGDGPARAGRRQLQFSADGAQVFVREGDNVFSIFDADSRKRTARHVIQTAGREQVWHASWHPHGTRLAIAYHGASNVEERDPRTGAILQPRAPHRYMTMRVHYSPDGRLLATTGYDHLIRIHRVRSGDDN